MILDDSRIPRGSRRPPALREGPLVGPYIVRRFAEPHSIKLLLSGGRDNRTFARLLPMRAVAGVDSLMSRPP